MEQMLLRVVRRSIGCFGTIQGSTRAVEDSWSFKPLTEPAKDARLPDAGTDPALLGGAAVQADVKQPVTVFGIKTHP